MADNLPPAGQIVQGWLAVERIVNTRTWLMRCTTCKTELRISSIALGKSLGLGEKMPACAGCSDTTDNQERSLVLPDYPDDETESVLDPTSVVIDLDGVDPQWVIDGIKAAVHGRPNVMDNGVTVEFDDTPMIQFGGASATRDEEMVLDVRDRLLAPFRRAMAADERDRQVEPGPSGVGGCARKLAHRILFPEQIEAEASGWAATRGKVLHAWAASIVGPEIERNGWMVNLELPKIVWSVTGGSADLYIPGRIVDLKFPGDWSWKRIVKGYRSPASLAQLQVYGLGAKMLGLQVDAVGLLVLPPNDKFDDTVYEEWPFDEEEAWRLLDTAELHRIHGRGRRADYLSEVADLQDDYCSKCPARKNGHCRGYALESQLPTVVDLGLTLERGE